MTTHTPGPWRVGDAGATVFGPKNGTPSPETIASVRRKPNARLIAAAPELLATLKVTLTRLEFLNRLTADRMACGYIDNEFWMTTAREAIASAEADS